MIADALRRPLTTKPAPQFLPDDVVRHTQYGPGIVLETFWCAAEHDPHWRLRVRLLSDNAIVNCSAREVTKAVAFDDRASLARELFQDAAE